VGVLKTTTTMVAFVFAIWVIQFLILPILTSALAWLGHAMGEDKVEIIGGDASPYLELAIAMAAVALALMYVADVWNLIRER